jgi:sterol desaturase/sphingolipid hydroxylase (fatty acid hydroxylase superfamily)
MLWRLHKNHHHSYRTGLIGLHNHLLKLIKQALQAAT